MSPECRDCAHAIMDICNLTYTCEHPQAYIGKTYKPVYIMCIAMRLEEGKCKPEGLLFKAKDKS